MCVGALVYRLWPTDPVANALGMLAGRERSEQDWRDLLTSAGFTGIGILPTGSPVSVIHATVR